MSENGNSSGKWLAFATYNAPKTGETWHMTIRAGASETDVERMFELVQHASGIAKVRGFDGIVEGSEFGGMSWKSGVPASVLAERREQRQQQAGKKQAAQEQKDRHKREQQALQRGNPPSGKGLDPALASKLQGQQPSGPAPKNGKYQHGWDVKQSPIEVSKIVVQGTKGKPFLVMHSPNQALKHPVFTNIAPVVVLNCFTRDYDLSGEVTIGKVTSTLEQAVEGMLTDIGREVDGLQWFVHWEPSEKNPKWKDFTSIEVTKWADIARNKDPS